MIKRKEITRISEIRKPSDLRYVKGVIYTDVFKYLPKERVHIKSAQRRFLISLFLSPSVRFYTFRKTSGYRMRFLFSVGSEFASFAAHLRARLANVATGGFIHRSLLHCDLAGTEVISFYTDSLPLSTYSFFKNSFFRINSVGSLERCLPDFVPRYYFTYETLAYMLMDTGYLFVDRDETGVSQHFAEIRVVMPWIELAKFMAYIRYSWGLEVRFRPVYNPKSFLRGQREFAVRFWSPRYNFWKLVWPHFLPTFRFLFKLVLSRKLD